MLRHDHMVTQNFGWVEGTERIYGDEKNISTRTPSSLAGVDDGRYGYPIPALQG